MKTFVVKKLIFCGKVCLNSSKSPYHRLSRNYYSITIILFENKSVLHLKTAFLRFAILPLTVSQQHISATSTPLLSPVSIVLDECCVHAKWNKFKLISNCANCVSKKCRCVNSGVRGLKNEQRKGKEYNGQCPSCLISALCM